MDRANRFYRLPPQVLATSACVGWFALVWFAGCSSWISKKGERDNHFQKETKRIQDLMADPDRPRLIGEVANSLGMSPSQYDSYALVSSLPGTGGIVRPGIQRDWILDEMRKRETESPETFLDDVSTALVKLKIIAKPCDAKGDIFDIEIDNCTECLATDLTEGYVLESRLSELAMLKGRLHTSEPKAIGSGEVVILPTSFTRNPEITPLKGVVIGGAKLKQDQPIGLRIEPEFRHVIVTKAIEKAINARFFYKDSNKQKMVAEGTSDWYLSVLAVPKYRHDCNHFMSVIKCTGFGETSMEQQERLIGCKKLLSDPATSRRAAAELEAIGTDEAKSILVGALSSSDAQVRFFSAYSLAYLDCKEASPVLLDLAQTTPAARALCLVGLVVNEDSSARVALEELLQAQDPDLRFGAFKAIRQKNPSDMTAKGETIGKNFQFVQVPSSIPLLTVSLQKHKEVILFGNSIALMLNAPIAPTTLLTLTPVSGDQIKITKRHVSGEIRNAIVPSDVVSVIRGFGTIDASYNDVVHTLNQLAISQSLATPVAMNPLHNQDSQIVNAANDYLKEFTESKEVTVDNATIAKGSFKSSSFLSAFGFKNAAWGKSKSNSVKEESESNEKDSASNQ